MPFCSSWADYIQRGTAWARGKLACSAPSRVIASAVALVRVPRECRLHVGGHSSHVAPRSCTEGERPPTDDVSLHSTRTVHSQRSKPRARGRLACCVTSRETASAVARARVPRESRLRVGGHSSHAASRSCAERERPSVDAVSFQNTYSDRSQRGTVRARGKLACLQPCERQPAQWRLFACHANASCMLEATALASHHGLAPKERGLPPTKCRFVPIGTVTASAARRAHATDSRVVSPPER